MNKTTTRPIVLRCCSCGHKRRVAWWWRWFLLGLKRIDLPCPGEPGKLVHDADIIQPHVIEHRAMESRIPRPQAAISA